MTREWALAIVALLMATCAYAEDVYLDTGVNAVTSSQNSCSVSTAPGTLDDDPNSPSGDWCTATQCDGSSASNAVWVVEFNTPSANPSTGTDEQEFAVYARKCSSGGNDPHCEITFCCNGAVVVETGASPTVSSLTGEIITDAFTFATTGCAGGSEDGSDLELCLSCDHAAGAPSTRRSVDVDAVEWRATLAGGRRVIIVGKVKEP